MKTYILTLSVLLLTFYSCKKEEIPEPDEPVTGVITPNNWNTNSGFNLDYTLVYDGNNYGVYDFSGRNTLLHFEISNNSKHIVYTNSWQSQQDEVLELVVHKVFDMNNNLIDSTAFDSNTQLYGWVKSYLTDQKNSQAPKLFFKIINDKLRLVRLYQVSSSTYMEYLEGDQIISTSPDPSFVGTPTNFDGYTMDWKNANDFTLFMRGQGSTVQDLNSRYFLSGYVSSYKNGTWFNSYNMNNSGVNVLKGQYRSLGTTEYNGDTYCFFYGFKHYSTSPDVDTLFVIATKLDYSIPGQIIWDSVSIGRLPTNETDLWFSSNQSNRQSIGTNGTNGRLLLETSKPNANASLFFDISFDFSTTTWNFNKFQQNVSQQNISNAALVNNNFYIVASSPNTGNYSINRIENGALIPIGNGQPTLSGSYHKKLYFTNGNLYGVFDNDGKITQDQQNKNRVLYFAKIF